jgi:hypothetical protein
MVTKSLKCAALESCNSNERCTKTARLVFNGKVMYCADHFNTLMSGEMLCDYDGYNVISIRGNTGVFFTPKVAQDLMKLRPDIGAKFVHKKVSIKDYTNTPILTSMTVRNLGKVNGRTYVSFSYGTRTYGPYDINGSEYKRLYPLTQNSDQFRINRRARDSPGAGLREIRRQNLAEMNANGGYRATTANMPFVTPKVRAAQRVVTMLNSL